MFEAALGTALTFILLFFYFDVRKVAGFAILLDIGIFALMLWLFKGTYAGMMTGIIAGIIITAFLRLVRVSIGYKVLRLRRKKDELVPRIRWSDTKRAL
jgi:thiamine transporter ThiT